MHHETILPGPWPFCLELTQSPVTRRPLKVTAARTTERRTAPRDDLSATDSNLSPTADPARPRSSYAIVAVVPAADAEVARVADTDKTCLLARPNTLLLSAEGTGWQRGDLALRAANGGGRDLVLLDDGRIEPFRSAGACVAEMLLTQPPARVVGVTVFGWDVACEDAGPGARGFEVVRKGGGGQVCGCRGRGAEGGGGDRLQGGRGAGGFRGVGVCESRGEGGGGTAGVGARGEGGGGVGERWGGYVVLGVGRVRP